MIVAPPKSGSRGVYIGPSEAQSAALAERDRPFGGENARSRRRRFDQPPGTVDGLVAWFAAEYTALIPDRLHGTATWADHGRPPREVMVTNRETHERERVVLPAVEGVGGSLLGSPSDAGLVPYLDAPPHARDDEGDLVRPLRSAMAALRRERLWGHSLLVILASSGFAWRQLAGKAVYQREHRHGTGPWCRCPDREGDDVTDSRRIVMMALPEDVLEDALVRNLTRLWWLLSEREPHVREV